MEEVACFPLPIFALLFYLSYRQGKDPEFRGFLTGRRHWKSYNAEWEGRADMVWEEDGRVESDCKSWKTWCGRNLLDTGFG